MTRAIPTGEAESEARRKSRLGLTAAACAVFVAGTVGMAFAAVPLYQIFCQVTGYGGTTQRAANAPPAIDRPVTVRFDANIVNGLGWSFRPQTRQVRLKAGEVGQAVFVAENRTDHRTSGTAAFNVSPLEAGVYFNKIACFCFSDQMLEPGESAELPVTFFVDPAIADDKELDSIHTITLSYTFYPAEPAKTAAVVGRDRAF